MLENLVYDKYEHEKATKNNYRNVYSKKKIKASESEIELKILRDCKCEFEPQIISKYQKDISDLEHKAITTGISTRDIEDVIKDIYGISVDAILVSRITDKILPKITELNNRHLEKNYAMIFIDGIRFKVKHDNQRQKSVYIAMGYSMDGIKDVLGFWISESESAKYWLNILNDLKTSGLEDILIISCDNNLKGISEAINSAYPKTKIQKCVVHQIRNSTAFVRYDDLKEFATDMKKIYAAPTLESSEKALIKFEEKWKSKYNYAIKSWKNNFAELVTLFNFPQKN